MLPAKVRAVIEFLAGRWKKPLPEGRGASPVHDQRAPAVA
jgi:hypothetical protein